jgi:predicted RNA binding protein YcfA (HicA-like mRNA interferase family)
MPGRVPRVTADEVLRALSRDGWSVTRQSGAHAILRHPTKPGRVVVPIHRGRTLKIGTMSSILTQAGLTPDEFGRLL